MFSSARPSPRSPSYIYYLCPIPVAASAPLSLYAARRPGRAAETARSGKETKYKAACDANGLELLPICIESTGARWGKACDDFFKKY
jgi:hypothetical protein